MKKLNSRSSSAQLPESTREHLKTYALAATAAGVGLLASSHPAEARIVYTPTNKKINGTVPLDLNHDGIADFNLIGTGNGTTEHSHWSSRSAVPVAAENRVWGNKVVKFFNRGSLNVAFDLRAGVPIGPKGEAAQPAGPKFMAGYYWFANSTGQGKGFAGPWANGGKGVSDRYLGLAFVIKGKTHFGWARLSVGPGPLLATTLTGYAYETIPNKPIITGKTHDDAEIPVAGLTHPEPNTEPATLGALALGSPGLVLWRREPTEIANCQ